LFVLTITFLGEDEYPGCYCCN